VKERAPPRRVRNKLGVSSSVSGRRQKNGRGGGDRVGAPRPNHGETERENSRDKEGRVDHGMRGRQVEPSPVGLVRVGTCQPTKGEGEGYYRENGATDQGG